MSRPPDVRAAEHGPGRRTRSDGGLGRRSRGEGGFTLVEVLICTLILTTGMIAIAALLAVTAQMHIGSREATRSTRLAQDKIDELMKLDFDADAEVAEGGDLNADEDGYSEALEGGITLRWLVGAGPTGDLRVLTVRVVHTGAQQYRQSDLVTIIRRW